jgi:hypothetical protein
MGSYSSRKKNSQPEHGRPLRAIGTFFLGTVVGAVLALFIDSWFVSMLPGPQITASVDGFRPMSGKSAGCIFYNVRVDGGDQPIEFVYLKAQLPTKINDFKVGHPSEAQTPITGRAAMWVWVGDKDAQGACTIQAPLVDSIDVQGAHTGNMIKIHASKLPPKTTIYRDHCHKRRSVEHQTSSHECLHRGGIRVHEVGPDGSEGVARIG